MKKCLTEFCAISQSTIRLRLATVLPQSALATFQLMWSRRQSHESQVVLRHCMNDQCDVDCQKRNIYLPCFLSHTMALSAY